MMSLNDNGPGLLQCFVDQFFEHNSHYWKDVYQEKSLNAFIYHERKSVVLATVEELGLPSRSLVLEVGCGTGFTTVALAERDYIVDAIDTVETMLNLTRRTALDACVASRAKTSMNNVLNMNFLSERFDLVVAIRAQTDQIVWPPKEWN